MKVRQGRSLQGEGLVRADSNRDTQMSAWCLGKQPGPACTGLHGRGAAAVAAQQGKASILDHWEPWRFLDKFYMLFLTTVWSTNWKVERDWRQLMQKTHGCLGLGGLGQADGPGYISPWLRSSSCFGWHVFVGMDHYLCRVVARKQFATLPLTTAFWIQCVQVWNNQENMVAYNQGKPHSIIVRTNSCVQTLALSLTLVSWASYLSSLSLVC